ncbi:thiamine pyrophosphate-binding protein [uncultured Shewanella sp.]|uniref:thiamine pyrophosphate-binding protein n=1 Tax=uncultured Shewanella sp. TaxID=173975 RepID=UPI002606B8CC|nr:thiamine pyrophosphate-binding protein [uncultured Shewanella sp.]
MPYNVSTCLMQGLSQLGIRHAFGVSGGGIAHLYDGILHSELEMSHFRHESGAVFAAAEAYFANQEPVVVFVTTGPGIINSLNALMAAKTEGAKLIFLSGCTGASQRGRGAIQETSHLTTPQSSIFSPSEFFDFALRVESGSELPTLMQQLSVGLSQSQGFIAHVSLPMDLQSAFCEPMDFKLSNCHSSIGISDEIAEKGAALLTQDKFAVWVGFGARKASEEIKVLVERTQARVFCTPRAKGIFPENHEYFVGVTGMGGHDEVDVFNRDHRPDWILVLGTRLGESSCFWQKNMEPKKGFIHVDIDSRAFGVGFNQCYTMGIQADIKVFLQQLLAKLPPQSSFANSSPTFNNLRAFATSTNWEQQVFEADSPPQVSLLMAALQEFVINKTDAIIMAECGNAFAWTNHYLRFDLPNRYRVSAFYGSMGHFGAGVVGAAKVHHDKAFTVIGDGSMLMQHEVHTAVNYRLPAVWIVLNDAGYGLCEMGLKAMELKADETSFEEVDFVQYANSLGAKGYTVNSNADIQPAVLAALHASGPFIIDVKIMNTNEKSPFMGRIESLKQQAKGAQSNVPAWGLNEDKKCRE